VKKLIFLLTLLLVGVAGAAPSVVTTTQTSATVEGLDCGSTYQFQIRKYNADGSLGSTTTSVDAQTKSCPDTQPPSPPQNLATIGATQTSISVSWSASTDNVGVGGYHLYRGGAKVDWTSATSYTFGGLSCGTSYALAVEADDAAGNRSVASATTASTAACPAVSCPVGEYSAQYYGNTTLSGTPVLQRCEAAINHDWASGGPGGTVPADRFSTRWTRKASFTAGSYQFTATADDGIRVWIDGALLVDAWKDQAPTVYQATRTLTAGDHDVKVEYYESAGGAVAKVSWQLNQLLPPPPPPPPPPPSSCPTGEYSAQYYGNTTLSGTPVLQRCEAAINHEWGSGSPGGTVPADRFSARWTRTASFTADTYQFTATTNDGMRVWVDGTLLLDKWFDQPATTYHATKTLTAGDHTIKVEHYESTNNATARLSWQASTPPPPPPGSEPGPIAGQGYTKVFADEFQTFDTTVWTNKIWYDVNPPADAIYAQDGVLHLVSRRSQGYPDISVTTLDPGDMKPNRTFRYGYFESRFRWPKGAGEWSAFWLLSSRHAMGEHCPPNGVLSGEIDVFEGLGHKPDVFNGAIHRNSGGLCGVSNLMNSNNWQPQGFDLTADFHVYSALWTPTEVRWYLDGRETHRTSTFDSTNQDMFIIFDQWDCSWDGRCPDSTTPDEMHTEVDWVRVWQK
jgi:chitodextrinase